MCGPAPAAQELSDHAESIRNDPGWSIDPSTGFTVPLDLWNTMLNLIYTGHMDLAWKFYDDAWPPDKPGKNAFLAEFAQKLATSPYWHDIQAMNANAAPMPAQP